MNPNRLKAAMALLGMTSGDTARAIGMSRSLFSEKMNCAIRPNGNPAEFTQQEIAALKTTLSLSNDEVIKIFFNEKSS